MMKKPKNNLDERQEQMLLKIEHNGCWFAFWGLLVMLFVQKFIYGGDFRYTAGEWFIFMGLAIYLTGASIKNGIWDRHLKPNAKTNLIASLIAAAAVGVIMFTFVFYKYPDAPYGAAASGLLSAVMVFILCFTALLLMAKFYRKRQEKLEEELEDGHDEEEEFKG